MPCLTAPEEDLLERLVAAEQSPGRLPGDAFVLVSLGYRGLAIFYPHAKPIIGFERAVLERLRELGLVRIIPQRSGAHVCQITREGYATAQHYREAADRSGNNEHGAGLPA
jgi:hypothetical protein